jgi:hypothetical protein
MLKLLVYPYLALRIAMAWINPRFPQRLFWVSILGLAAFAAKPAPVSNASMPTLRFAGGGKTQPKATAAARGAERQKQERQIRPENYDLRRHPVTDAKEKHWRNILWTTAVINPPQPFVARALSQLLTLTQPADRSEAQTRTIDMALQVGTQLYLNHPTTYAAVGSQLAQTIERSNDPHWVAMALSALAKSGMPAGNLQRLGDRVRQRFPNWAQEVVLYTTLKDVEEQLRPLPSPPLSDLLKWSVAARQPQLYVLCQPDRHILCQAVLKDGNGQFLREPAPTGKTAGKLWSVPLLLRSQHNLAWNFFRGSTPQGIYRIQGLVDQPDDEFFLAYGQFPLVNLFTPFEAGVKEFLPGKSGRFADNIDAYQALLPASWRNHWGLQQSYWAGKLGRSLIRIHGSGESPDFFNGKGNYADSYNWNPTIGCLSALEIYNEAGKVIQADIPKLLKALVTVGGNQFTGYLVVVDIPRSSPTPISVAEIEAAINPRSPGVNETRLPRPIPSEVTGY